MWLAVNNFFFMYDLTDFWSHSGYEAVKNV